MHNDEGDIVGLLVELDPERQAVVLKYDEGSAPSLVVTKMQDVM